MALEIQETVSIDDADVWDELKELIPSLLEDGIRVSIIRKACYLKKSVVSF